MRRDFARVPCRVGDVGIGVGIAHRVDGEEARLAVLGQAEEPAEHGIVDVDDAERLAAHLRPQVGGEVDRDAVGEDPASVDGNAEPVAHRAVGAIGSDQVAGVAGVRGVAVDVAHHHRDTVRILLDVDDLAPLQHPCTGSLGATAQDRLQPGLCHEQTPARTQRVVDTHVEAGDDVGELPPGEAVHADDRTLGEELPFGLSHDLLVDTSRAEQLEGAHVEVRRPRERRPATQAFDDQRRHAVVGEEHRRRQPNQAATGDDDGKLRLIPARPRSQLLQPSPGVLA